jgi:surface protein
MIPIRIGTMAVQAVVSRYFVIQINTSISGFGTVTGIDQFRLPALGEYTVYWGDNTVEDIEVFTPLEYVTHTYPSPGIYNIIVIWTPNSTDKQISFNNSGDRNKLQSIRNWGNTIWTSMEGAYRGCTNLVATFADRPDLSQVTKMNFMFSGATNYNSPMASWDTSSVTDMSYLFQNAINFNQDIGLWNTGLVENMSFMFQNALAFDQDIGSWDTSSVENISNMFDGCLAFNQNIGSWDTSAVTDMSSVFFGAAEFDQDIGSWDTSAVQNMSNMFRSASAFNQDIGTWSTAAVVNMSSMFRGASAFNQSLNGWNTGAVTNMAEMFREASAFNQTISSWNVSNVNSMSGMFNSAASFNQDISTWDTGGVTSMSNMFRSATAFNQSIGSWDTTSVSDMSNMFRNSLAFDQDIGDWIVSAVTNFVDFMAEKTDANFTAANLDLIYNGWTDYELQPGRSINFNTIKYTAAGAESRALLTRSDATVSVTNAQDNGAGLIRITAIGHGLSTGNKVFIKNVEGTTEANGAWIVTVFDADNIDLQSSTFTNVYTTGGNLRTGYGWSIIDGGV